jgi:dephospho-CoA kinase
VVKVIGLTGGIASGKSTVAGMLVEAGVALIDADAVVHQLYQTDAALVADLVHHFGPTILDPTSQLNRQALGQQVFNQPERLALLGQLVHPRVRQALVDFALAQPRLAVLVIPLLYENGLHHGIMAPSGQPLMFDQIWLCAVPHAVQRQRLITLRGLTPEEADHRLASQLSLTDKLKYSPMVIDCNGTIESTREQVRQLLAPWVS